MSNLDAADRTDVVELSIPVRADLVVLARLTAATMASRADFGVEEIEDLRLAVEELCLSIVRSDDGGGRLRFTYVRQRDAVEIACSLERDPEHVPDRQEGDRVVDDLSLRILDALVDEHRQEYLDGRPSAWLRKRRAGAATR
jgi:anti-sigma regulatory factor (Ser/Thr protein kinase)